MQISLNWLNQLTKAKWTALQASTLLSQAGLPVAATEKLSLRFAKMAVGQVVRVEPHPTADRLKVAQVRLSASETRTIVCGAPNVAPGQKVIVALPGSRLANGQILERTQIRGVESDGMICAEDELGLGSGHQGILVLDDRLRIGAPASSALGTDDVSLDIEVTPNRSDCLSAVGLARELAFISGRPFKMPAVLSVSRGRRSPVRVRVQNKSACPKYAARVVAGLKLGPTPLWLRSRLLASGIRPISLVVDVTNFVMLELGQPLHAFDLSKISRNEIIVRFAKAGEKLVTLDGVDRALKPFNLIIADQRGPLALAGVMGGRDSGVTEATQAVVLESAVFESRVVRKTARTLHLFSEASARFERGVDPDRTEIALERAAQLLVDLGHGQLQGGVSIASSARLKPVRIRLPLSQLSQWLNRSFKTAEVKKILTNLGVKVSGVGSTLNCQPPTWRHDLNIAEDLIEEVARRIGYHNLTPTRLCKPLRPVMISKAERLIETARDRMVQLGYTEVFTDSQSQKDAEGAWEVANPLTPQDRWLRTELLTNIETVARQNLSREPGLTLSVFEIGTVFIKKSGPDNRPAEAVHIAGTWWSEPARGDWPGSTVKGHVADLLNSFSLDSVRFRESVIETSAGPVGRWSSRRENVVGQRVYTAESFEIRLDRLIDQVTPQIFKAIPVYPPVKRDISLWLPKTLDAAELVKTMRSASPLLTNVEPFDHYEQSDRLSVAWHLTFQAPDRTLSSQAVDQAIQAINRRLAETHQITIRQ